MDSFSNYIDHLILLLAARFQAPLEVSTEELLSPVNGSAESNPWELVSRTVQMSLCAPQTEQERLSMRHLDIHHFSASVCRERARYVQWKLSEDNSRRQAERRRKRVAAKSTVATQKANSISTTAASVASNPNSFDITHDSAQQYVTKLYALVRQSLPSTLTDEDEEDDTDSDEDESQAMKVALAANASREAADPTATASSLLAAQVRDVFVPTEEERHRDEQAARARDEFLSQIQALQMVYYNRYHRWMDVPDNVLEPPSLTNTVTATRPTSSFLSSCGSSTSVGGGEAVAAVAQRSTNGTRSFNRRSDEDERASLLAVLKPTHHTSSSVTEVSAATPKIRTGAHPTIAAMCRQVHLQRSLRPSAVASANEEENRNGEQVQDGFVKRALSGSVSVAHQGIGRPAATAPTSTAAVSAESDATEKKAPTNASLPVPVIVSAKETAPPASRRGRWQIVEYDDADDHDDP